MNNLIGWMDYHMIAYESYASCKNMLFINVNKYSYLTIREIDTKYSVCLMSMEGSSIDKVWEVQSLDIFDCIALILNTMQSIVDNIRVDMYGGLCYDGK